jgi:hypothetical protein
MELSLSSQALTLDQEVTQALGQGVGQAQEVTQDQEDTLEQAQAPVEAVKEVVESFPEKEVGLTI